VVPTLTSLFDRGAAAEDDIGVRGAGVPPLAALRRLIGVETLDISFFGVTSENAT
jgi:hypothetical protein